MALSYPNRGDTEGRLKYWTRQIDFAEKYYAPIFEASETLISQYNMEPASLREKLTDQSSSRKVDPAVRVKANLVYGWVDQHISNLAAHDPRFRVQPFNQQGVGAETSVARISDYWYRETGQLAQDKRVLLDAFLSPFGVSKIGWTADIEGIVERLVNFDPDSVIDDPMQETEFLLGGQPTRIMPDQLHEQHIEIHVAMTQQPNITPAARQLVEAHIKEHDRMLNRGDPDRNTTVKWESPFGQRWEFGSFLIDPLAQNGLSDARWIAFKWRRPVDEVVSDGSLSNTTHLEPDPHERIAGAPEMDPRFVLDDFGMVTGYEIWARNFPVDINQRRNLFINFSKHHSKFFRDDEDWPYERLEDYPAEILNFNAGIHTWFNKPPLLMAGADSVQTLIHEIMDSYLHVVRKQKNLFLYDPEYLEEGEIDDVLASPDMTAFSVEGLAQSNGRAVIPIEFGNVMSEKGELLSIAERLLDRAAGTPQPGRVPDPESATEANIIDRKATAREDERSDLFEKFQIRKANKFWKLTTEFKPERLFLIDPRAQKFVQIDDDVVKGEYAFEIDISSSAQAVALERKQWLDLLNLFAGMTEVFQLIHGQPPNIARIAELLLVRGYQIQDPATILPFLEQALAAGPENIEEEIIQQLTGQPGGGGGPSAAVSAAIQKGGDRGPIKSEQFRGGEPAQSRVLGQATRITTEGSNGQE